MSQVAKSASAFERAFRAMLVMKPRWSECFDGKPAGVHLDRPEKRQSEVRSSAGIRAIWLLGHVTFWASEQVC